MAGGVMGAVPMGGSITAILWNTSGSAPNAATCLDGYPMVQRGEAGLAIGAAAGANAVGGIFGMISLTFVLPVSKVIVLAFGPPEFCLLAVLGLVMVATTQRGTLPRSLLVGGFGLMIATIGYDQVNNQVRFPFGSDCLWDGIRLIPALIGLFAVAEMINLWVKSGTVAAQDAPMKVTRLSEGMLATFRYWPTVLRGSLIGTVVGGIPGVGGTGQPSYRIP